MRFLEVGEERLLMPMDPTGNRRDESVEGFPQFWNNNDSNFIIAPKLRDPRKGKIQTLTLAAAADRGDEAGRIARENAIRKGILKERRVIDADIRKRNEQRKRGAVPATPQPVSVNGKREEPPPPTHF